MTTAILKHPAQLGRDDGNGGVPARRAMIRWAGRLFRREWRQQLLVLALIIAAVGATVLGAAVATNTPMATNAGFGTANHIVTIPGNDPHLATDIVAIKARFGSIDVIENENIATGTVNTAVLRAQDPRGRYGSPMLSLVSGHYPSGPDEAALTQGLATTFNVRVGDTWRDAGQVRRVVGLVENPQNLADEFALVAPGQIKSPTQVTVMFNATASGIYAAQSAGFKLPSGASVETPPPPTTNIINPSTLVLVLDTFGLLLIGLVAVAGFTVMAQRRMRALGMLGALGATDRHIRLVMIANGAVVGVMGTLIGAVLGFAGWFAYRPRLETSANHVIAPFHLPWWLIGTAMVLAVVTAILAARRPARAMARLPIVAALSGRPPSPKEKQVSAMRGGILVAVGFGLIAIAGGSKASGGMLPLLLGIVALVIGSLFLAPVAIAGLADLGHGAPIAMRLALRDLARYRSRSSTALGAISVSIIIAVITCVVASARASDVLDYSGPNLAPNQLVVYVGCGAGEGNCPFSPVTGAKARALRSEVAASLGTHEVLDLDSAVYQKTANIPTSKGGNPTATLFQMNTSRNYSGPLYVATPAMLHLFGIRQSTVASNADILTSRVGLAGLPNMQILFGDAFNQGPSPGCSPSSCFNNPKIETVSSLPTGTSAPNTVITEHALHALGLTLAPTGFLYQTAKPLTAVQINDARELAASTGASIETKNSEIGLSQLTELATAAGILLALGILAMTVGLIRSETASDLRILAATGASSRTRRALTGVTAGALGLLGALLGTAVGYVACIGFFGSKLGELTHPPILDLLLIIVGMPLVAAAGGWLFSGRQPPAIARSPME
jgi:putative ABC transport system permease protein